MFKRAYKNYMIADDHIFSDYSEDILTQRNEWREWLHEQNPDCDYGMYEVNIHPMIRFIHETNIEPSGWVEIMSENDEECKFSCDIELCARYTALKPIKNNSLSVIIKYYPLI